jgi:hypothetical protein
MIPEHIKKVLVNGDIITPIMVTEIKQYLTKYYPSFARFFSDGAIDSYNKNTLTGRKATASMILRYIK